MYVPQISGENLKAVQVWKKLTFFFFEASQLLLLWGSRRARDWWTREQATKQAPPSVWNRAVKA
jgi:hypothetical protein